MPEVRQSAKERRLLARGGVPRKRGKRVRTKTSAESDGQDPNAEIILPQSNEEKKRRKEEKLRFELMKQSNSKMNSKKKKRLEKYIEKKLRQEEKQVILEKLSKSQAEIPSTIFLQSSSTLGAGIPTPDRLQRLEAKQAQEATASDSSDTDADSEDGTDATQAIPANAPHTPNQKRLKFKDWALEQLSAAKHYVLPVLAETPPPVHPTPSIRPPSPPPAKKRKISDSRDQSISGPLGEVVPLPSSALSKQLQNPSNDTVKTVLVTRSPDVQEARLLLPIVSEEQPIMEAIRLNPVVIICGETGSGKTTQVPQFLYEAGFGTPGSDNPGMIGITQPRRVAALSMAARVAHELSLTSSRVSYQIRYDATVSPSTSIKFMTDGVLLRELATDFLLSKYSVIIIDEAHERSINTDILIGVLSRVIKLRQEMWKEGKKDIKPLRLVIMSATLRVADFAENKTLFPSPPPVINVPARQHSVSIHFSRRTPSDYVAEAIKKTFKIHARLPPGGILIFLTGQNEITGVCRKLEAKCGKRALEEKRKRRGFETEVEAEETSRMVAAGQADVEAEEIDLGCDSQDNLAFDIDGDDSSTLEEDERGLDDELGIDAEESDAPMHIVPLYSLLPSEMQMEVFKPPPPGSRLVVVATNVAETSLTIPGIRYVVDCGRAKERRYDVTSGIQSFQVGWISKASASQRAGRAGRTGPGHCYRLYSSAVYEHHFKPFSQPEILRMPIEGVVLIMKSMHIDAVVNFPFPTAPDRSTLKTAETVLSYLGALAVPATLTRQGKHGVEVMDGATIGGHITDLGRVMSLFPLSPRFSRMLVGGRKEGCLPFVISIVSALSVGEFFVREEALEGDGDVIEEGDAAQNLSHLNSGAVKVKEARKKQRKKFFRAHQIHGSLGEFTSDLFKVLSVVGAYEFAGGGHKFCEDNFVRPKAMEETHKLQAQISNIVQANFPGAATSLGTKLRPPNDLQLKILKQLIAASFIDQVAIRKDLTQKNPSGVKYTTPRGIPYQAVGISEDVYIHPSSVTMAGPPPDYVVFLEVVRTSRVWIKGITIVHPAWLASLGKSTLCTFSKPTKSKDGSYVVTPHFGPQRWELPAVKVDM